MASRTCAGHLLGLVLEESGDAACRRNAYKEDTSIPSQKQRAEPVSVSREKAKKKLKVQVWIYREPGPEVLLLLLKPERGAFWQPVTGGVEEGEALEQAALREATEETGLEFAGKPHSLDYQFTFAAKDRQFEEHVYSLRVSSADLKVHLDPHEHVDYRWVAARNAANLLKHASNAEGLSRLLEKLGKDTRS